MRPGFEIDTRSLRTDSGYGGGLDMRVSAKSTVRVEAHTRSLDFKDDEFFDGTNLSWALNRDSTTGAVSLRQALTPLTTFVVKTEYLEDRFEFASYKDANALAVMPGFELDPLALISGKVFVGYRHYRRPQPAGAGLLGPHRQRRGDVSRARDEVPRQVQQGHHVFWTRRRSRITC